MRTNSRPAGEQEEIARVRHYIREITGDHYAGTEAGAVLDAVLDAEGKMLRPRLLLLSAGFGPQAAERRETLYLLAAMVELTHMASLIHDDIIDNAQFRRGKPSVQGRFGKDAAVYAGDLLICRVNRRLAQEGLTEASVLLSETIERMCAGEIGQAAWRYREDVTAARYDSNIRGKTASLFRCACTLGAKEAGCGPEDTETLGLLGESIGIMFQLRDDLLDFRSTDAAQGKDTHKDFHDGIYTLPVILALETPEGGRLLPPLMRENRDRRLTAAEIAEMEDIVRRSGGLAAAEREVHRCCDRSLELLATLADIPARAVIGKLLRKLDAIEEN